MSMHLQEPRHVLFLDIDGVLNSAAWFSSRGKGEGLLHGIDPEAAARAERICAETGACVVLSSTWRLLHRMAVLRELLRRRGLTAEVVDKTPALGDDFRGEEVQAWLDAWYGEGSGPAGIVILDDDASMAHLSPWHVRTSSRVGLTDGDVERAVQILRSSPPFVRRLSEEKVPA